MFICAMTFFSVITVSLIKRMCQILIFRKFSANPLTQIPWKISISLMNEKDEWKLLWSIIVNDYIFILNNATFLKRSVRYRFSVRMSLRSFKIYWFIFLLVIFFLRITLKPVMSYPLQVTILNYIQSIFFRSHKYFPLDPWHLDIFLLKRFS